MNLEDDSEANVVSSWGPYMTTSGTAKKTAVPGLTAKAAIDDINFGFNHYCFDYFF